VEKPVENLPYFSATEEFPVAVDKLQKTSRHNVTGMMV
jgi:hypothetical protein